MPQFLKIACDKLLKRENETSKSVSPKSSNRPKHIPSNLQNPVEVEASDSIMYLRTSATAINTKQNVRIPV